MGNESIYNLRRPGFPKELYDSKSYRTTIEYVGLTKDLSAASPRINTAWGLYPGLISSQELDPIEGTNYGILTVICEHKFEPPDYGTPGTRLIDEITYEIDWVDVQRSLYEHPKFRIGGGGAMELTSEDVAAIKKWEDNPDPSYKKDFIYDVSEIGDHSGTLTNNAKMVARGIQLGIEFWIDKAPVAKRSDTWVNGPPPAGTAGQKQTPANFPHLPAGYEWIRSTDRAVRAASQASWTNETQWIGSKKVLIDVDEVFWLAP